MIIFSNKRSFFAFFHPYNTTLDRARHPISGVDHPVAVRLVCCSMLHVILSLDLITVPHVMGDEHNLLLCTSRVRDMLAL